MRASVVLLVSVALAACYSGAMLDAPPPPVASHPTCLAPSPGPAPLRRLTQTQYDHVVRDLLGDITHPARSFPADARVTDFSNNAETLVVSPLLAQAYQSAAESLSASALARPGWLPCSPEQDGEESCARTFIATFGKRAFRRPVTVAESDSLYELYAENRLDADFTNGARAVMEMVLQSAPFLYQVEAGDPARADRGVVPLTSWEMASRLSLFLWGTLPDDVLFAAAAAGELDTPEQIEAQARRMLTDGRAHDAVADFFSQWLRLDHLDGVSKDSALYPDFNDAMRASMRAETLQFADWALFSADGRVSTLLTAPVSFLDVNTAKLYGMAVSSPTPVRTSLDPEQRAGILTQPSFMTLLSKPNQSSPVLRGKWVRERFLCQPVSAPPANANTTAPDVKPGVSTRERFAEHAKNPACAGCHALMDPIGFGFEHYDALGRFRVTDEGAAVDASGALIGSDVDGAFDAIPELARKLAASREVTDCVSLEWFRYAFGRGETAADACSLVPLRAAFAAGNFDMKELLISMTRTVAFRFRPEVKP